MTKRIRLVVGVVAYLAAVAPGWFVAWSYDPATAPDIQLATAAVTNSRIVSTWSTEAEIHPQHEARYSAPAGVVGDVRVGDVLSQGSVLVNDTDNWVVMVACEAPPTQLAPQGAASPFVGCVQRLLSEDGATIDESEVAADLYGPSTVQAMRQFLAQRGLSAVEAVADGAQRIVEADFAAQRAQIESSAVPPEADAATKALAALNLKQTQQALESLQAAIGLIVEPSHFLVVPLDTRPTIVSINRQDSEATIQLGWGTNVAVARMPAFVAEYSSLAWTLDGEAVVDAVSISESRTDAETGERYVEVTVSTDVTERNVDLSVVMEDSIVSVLSLPAGCVRNDGQAAFVERVGEMRNLERITIPTVTVIAGRVVIEDGWGLSVGDKVVVP